MASVMIADHYITLALLSNKPAVYQSFIFMVSQICFISAHTHQRLLLIHFFTDFLTWIAVSSLVGGDYMFRPVLFKPLNIVSYLYLALSVICVYN